MYMRYLMRGQGLLATADRAGAANDQVLILKPANRQPTADSCWHETVRDFWHTHKLYRSWLRAATKVGVHVRAGTLPVATSLHTNR
jgi:hypothetical protein